MKTWTEIMNVRSKVSRDTLTAWQMFRDASRRPHENVKIRIGSADFDTYFFFSGVGEAQYLDRREVMSTFGQHFQGL